MLSSSKRLQLPNPFSARCKLAGKFHRVTGPLAHHVVLTGYGPRQGLVFDGDENKYELWEVKFLSLMRIQKLHDVFVPSEGEDELDEVKNANGFAELVQHLDDRSLSLIIREAKDDGRKALKVLREHY